MLLAINTQARAGEITFQLRRDGVLFLHVRLEVIIFGFLISQPQMEEDFTKQEHTLDLDNSDELYYKREAELTEVLLMAVYSPALRIFQYSKAFMFLSTLQAILDGQ